MALTMMSGSAATPAERPDAAQTDAVKRLLVTGTRLPPLTGNFLTGRKATLPDAATGKVALLALGFTYDSRFAVEEWTRHFRDRLGKTPGVTFFEVPMIGGIARMGRWFIDSGMRKGTPKELHENVVTVYGGTEPWKDRLQYKDKDAAYLILLDAGGTVRWLHAGPFEASKFNELIAEVSMLSAPAP